MKITIDVHVPGDKPYFHRPLAKFEVKLDDRGVVAEPVMIHEFLRAEVFRALSAAIEHARPKAASLPLIEHGVPWCESCQSYHASTLSCADSATSGIIWANTQEQVCKHCGCTEFHQPQGRSTIIECKRCGAQSEGGQPGV